MREESEEDWRAAWEHIKGYRTVDGYGRYQPGTPLEEQTTFEALMPEPPDLQNPHRFGEKSYAGEVRDLMSALDARRQFAADKLGADTRCRQCGADHGALIRNLQEQEGRLRERGTHFWHHDARGRAEQHIQDEATYPGSLPSSYDDITADP